MFFFSVDSNATRIAKEEVDRTLLHEATHQLFSESRPTSDAIARNENFWIIEGNAMYMETLHSEGEYYVVGGIEDIRIKNAIDEVLTERFYIPLEMLVVLGQPFYQSFPKLPEIYAQSAGLTHFLMHAKDGAFRDGTVLYLRLIYEGKDKSNTLSIQTKRSYKDLDELYLDYLRANRK